MAGVHYIFREDNKTRNNNYVYDLVEQKIVLQKLKVNSYFSVPVAINFLSWK